MLALEKLKGAYSTKGRLNRSQRERLAPIECLQHHPQLSLIQRAFEKAGIKFLDTCDKHIPRHDIESMEKITGVYLDQRLFLEAAKCGLFPSWIKPADTEPPPPPVYKWYLGDVRGQARHPDGGRTVEGLREDRSRLLAASSPTHPGPPLGRPRRNEGQHGAGPHERARPHLPIPVLCVRFPGPRSRNGSPRLRSLARQLVGLIPRFCHWSPLILYSHCVDKLHILFHFTADKEQDLVQRHFSTNSDLANNVVGCNNEHCWPQDRRIRLIEYNVDLGGVVFWNSERVC